MVLAQRSVRVRITRPLQGVIDGFNLEGLKVGVVYDLPSSIASLLIVDGDGDAEMRGSADKVPLKEADWKPANRRER